MTERPTRIIEAADLSRLIIYCAKCDAPFQLDPTSKDQEGGFGVENEESELAERRCPFCGDAFDRIARIAFNRLCGFFYYARLASGGMQFRLAATSTSGSPAAPDAARFSP